VRKAIFILGITCVSASSSAGAQPPADCTPGALNVSGAPYPCVLPDSRVMFRVLAPSAEKVTVRVAKGFEMSRQSDGLWHVTTTPQVVGFHCYTLSIDGAVVADPATHTFFRSGFDNSGSEEGPGAKTFSDQLTAGIANVYFESPGTAHEWLTWRRCLREFAPRLFR
jgi:hypothetical protein